jgi:predicted HTH domain antitoxin
MGLQISDDELDAARLSAEELRREIAVLLFQQDRFTIGQASAFAGMTQLDFQRLLASRRIPMHYDVADFEADLKTLQAQGDA